MPVITIEGTSGALEASIESAFTIAKELLLAGFSVHINGLNLAIEAGPGYDTVVFADGVFAGQPVRSS